LSFLNQYNQNVKELHPYSMKKTKNVLPSSQKNALFHLRSITPSPTSTEMHKSAKKLWRETNAFRWLMLIIGWFLVIGAPLLGPIPGPGPLIILPIGLALILRNSLWAKKRYARLARRHPEYGRWANWAIGRSKVTHRPAFPDIKGDFLHLFRRDDIDMKMP
jgi:hypothetical protein